MVMDASRRMSWWVYVIVTLVSLGFKALALRDMQAPEGRAAGSVSVCVENVRTTCSIYVIDIRHFDQ